MFQFIKQSFSSYFLNGWTVITSAKINIKNWYSDLVILLTTDEKCSLKIRVNPK